MLRLSELKAAMQSQQIAAEAAWRKRFPNSRTASKKLGNHTKGIPMPIVKADPVTGQPVMIFKDQPARPTAPALIEREDPYTKEILLFYPGQ